MDGIKLDPILSNAFKSFAYSSGFIKSKDKPIHLTEMHFNISEKNLSAKKDLYLESLSSLVLFGKILLPSYKNRRNGIVEDASNDGSFLLNYETLVNEGAIELVENKDFSSSGISLGWSHDDLYEIITLRDTILLNVNKIDNFLEPKGKPISKKKFINTFNKLEEFTNSISQGYARESYLGESITDFFYGDMNSDQALWHIIYMYQMLKDTEINTGRKNHIKTCFVGDKGVNQKDLDLNERVNRVYQIILEEKCNFPYPRTINEALRLRNDPRCIDFREIVLDWATNLKNGNIFLENKLRAEIKKAQKGLDKLNTYKKLGRIVTFTSVSISLISLLSGVPIGLITLPIGPALTLESIRLEKKSRWLAFGS